MIQRLKGQHRGAALCALITLAPTGASLTRSAPDDSPKQLSHSCAWCGSADATRVQPSVVAAVVHLGVDLQPALKHFGTTACRRHSLNHLVILPGAQFRRSRQSRLD
jgi:hypothetical protein